jgi:cysteine synthase
MNHPKTTLARSLLGAVLLASSIARADVIADWNTIALDTVTGSGRYRAYEETRVMAMVNTAMSEAIKFNEGRGPSRLLVIPSRPIGASSEAAAAAAAHYILTQLHPEAKPSLDVALERSLAMVADEAKRESGRIMGISLGMNLYALLRSDGL